MNEHTLPLSPSQLHLWTSQVISPDSPLFNQVSTATVSAAGFADTDVQLMERAWQSLQKLHPVFSTRVLDEGNGSPTQFLSHNTIPMEYCKLAPGVTDPQEWIQARSQRSFVLSESLVDAAMLRAGPEQFIIYLNMHHLIADALSTVMIWRILFAEFERLQSANRNVAPDLEQSSQPAAGHAFSDFLLSFSSPLPVTEVAQSPNSPQASALPARVNFYDQQSASPTTRSTRLSVKLAASDSQALSALSTQASFKLINPQLSEMCIHLTALSLFLHKISKDSTLVLDAPITGRFDKRWQGTVGNFIEIVRLRIAINSEDTLLDVFATCRQALFKALGNAKPGCTAELQAEAVHGVLNMISANTDQAHTIPAHIQWHHPGHSDTNHPLRLHVSDWNNSGHPSLDMDLNHAFIEPGRQQRTTEHLAAAYRALIHQTTASVQQVSLISADERWQFICDAAPATASAITTLPDAVAAVASRHVRAIAVADEQDSLNFADLLARSTRLSQQLQQRGIGHGDRVAVLMARGLNLPVVLLGVLQSGACYIPIDAAHARQRINDTLNESSPACVVCDAGNASLQDAGYLLLTAEDLLASADPTDEPSTTDQAAATKASRRPAAEDPAYIIFTSGSTGKPKGVVVSHGALMNYLNWAEPFYRLSTPTVMPLFTSIAFDLTVTSLYLPWLSGGQVQVFTQTDDDPATLLFKVFEQPSVNTVKLTPAHMALLAHSSHVSPKIEQLIVGGEDLKCATAKQTRACFRQAVRIVNEYGPTEVTVGSVVKDWTANSDKGSVPIGLPITGTSAYVLDEQAQPQLEGMVGELYLGGQSLASGYWNDAAKTAESFIAHPWQTGERLYRTGDLVRVQNGELGYLGRQDAQVNINGYRVELGDIEAVMASHPLINECVVLADEQALNAQADRATTDLHDYAETFCTQCGLSSRHPDANLNTAGLCTLCDQFAQNQQRVDDYFKTNEELSSLISEIKAARRGQYDAVVLLSGGKDSTFALSKLVDLGLTVYAFSLDNGFISDQAKNNIDAVCQSLGVDHHYGTTVHMNDIFKDSLTRYSNVCHGCFKTIYNLSMVFAAEHDIDYVFTGLSRGQLFETRLNNELFSDKAIPVQQIDDMVQAARVQYHAIKDAPNTLLNITEVNNGELPSKVSMVDFYRYCHVEMADMLAYLESRVGWVRPKDTGRSTNCLINDVGIHVHKLERGFHNYSLPYSWDVRLGHKTRSDALEELDDAIDEQRVDTILSEIGYEPSPEPVDTDEAINRGIRAFFTASDGVEPDALNDWLSEHLPSYMHPRQSVQIAAMPLSASGKIDRQALPGQVPVSQNQHTDADKAITLTEPQRIMASHWQKHLDAVSIGPRDNFFQIGGDSLSAIRCVMALRREGYSVEPADLFRHPVLADFCQLVEQKPNQHSEPATISVEAPEQFASLKPGQSEKLRKLLQRGSDRQA